MMTSQVKKPIEDHQAALTELLGARVQALTLQNQELTLTVTEADYHDVMATLRDHSQFRLEQLIDLCGVDYATYKDEPWSGPRFCVVVHLLSVSLNWRLRVKVFCPDNDWPQIRSVCDLWTVANWFEREAFDMFGIVFTGHPDLRRILTDYGFIGHPLRKDFPTQGHVEMRYDEAQRRVIYEPVSIELREITPRVIREDHYGGVN